MQDEQNKHDVVKNKHFSVSSTRALTRKEIIELTENSVKRIKPLLKRMKWQKESIWGQYGCST